jgi:uncharacterized membrane protein YccC
MGFCWQDMYIFIGGLAAVVSIISSVIFAYRGILKELHAVCDPIRQDAREAHRRIDAANARIDATIADGHARIEAANARSDAAIAESNARLAQAIAEGKKQFDQQFAQLIAHIAHIDQQLARSNQLYAQHSVFKAYKDNC